MYVGKENQAKKGSVSEHVVLKLTKDVIEYDRTLCINNWYTSIPLTRTFVKKNESCRNYQKKRVDPPEILTLFKLRKGGHAATQSDDGIMILKHHDKRDVLMLSTLHDDTIDENGKPQVILEYNVGKVFVDISDQMAAYRPYVRKVMK